VADHAEHHFPVDHPTAAGHFPGNPVIPGATLLDTVVGVISASNGRPSGPCAIRSAKFLHPVRPGDGMVIEWSASPNGEARFTCTVGEIRVLTGSLAR
jgi:3-hydroxymyristoyl/3-hydroxydecanoyl-(acyl carrier protein) dehydratase